MDRIRFKKIIQILHASYVRVPINACLPSIIIKTDLSFTSTEIRTVWLREEAAVRGWVHSA